MARYWAFMNDEVQGPFELEQLIRLPGFSRRTMVSIDDYSGGAGKWISPADIPELARIFQKADEIHESPVPAPKPAPKLVRPKMPTKLTPVAPPVEVSVPWYLQAWPWVLAACLLFGVGALWWITHHQRGQRADERQTAQALIETAPLPATSLYSNVRQYLQIKQITSRWEFERLPSGLYNVTVSWMPPEKAGSQMPVYMFEVNLQVQSVRGLNTAGSKLLAEGFPAPAPVKAAAAEAPKKSPGDYFPSAINERRQAFEQGDFETVWQAFSKRRKSEMSSGGINQSGFVRMQKLTTRGAPVQQSIVKTKNDSDSNRLVLIRQTQSKHPDIFIKQTWVWEENAWKLDEEEKKIAGTAPATGSEGPSETEPPPKIPAGLPGLSTTEPPH